MQRTCNSRDYASGSRLLDLTADFGVKINAKLTPIFKLQEKSKTGCSKLFVLQFLRKFPEVYSLIHNFYDLVL